MTPFLKQMWTVLGILLNMMSQGMMHGFPVSLLPALKKPDPDIEADMNTISWIASCVAIATIPGFVMSPIFMDIFGRRTAQIVATTPGIVGWVTIWLSKSPSALIIGRILTGYTAGASTVIGAVIIGEYTSPRHRGIFLNLKTTNVCLGILVSHFLDQFLNWRSIALVASGFNFVALLITLTWPESPVWLATKKRFGESEKAFTWLRGNSTEEMQEFHEILRVQKQRKALDTHSFFSFEIQNTKKKVFYKPILNVVLGMILLELCGRHLFPAYATEIIAQITGNKSNSMYYTLCIDLVVVLSSASSTLLVKLTKRRTFLFFTAVPALAVLSITCFYLLLVSRGIISSEYSFIPVTLLVLYYILANLGCTTIPFILLGEVLPLAYRKTGAILAGVTGAISLHATLHVSPYFLANFKVHGTFTILGIMMVICLTILYFIAPETKDRTLQEIENYFNYGNYKVREDDVNDKMVLNDGTKACK